MLNPKQKKFAEYYCGEYLGNAEQSALAAGYSASYARHRASRLTSDVGIQEYMRELTKADEEKTASTIADIRAFWADIMNSTEEETKNRLRASELLAKSSGMFNTDWQ